MSSATTSTFVGRDICRHLDNNEQYAVCTMMMKPYSGGGSVENTQAMQYCGISPT